eukprot:1157451-Pelagomonas_calceolata.AAC.8
MATIMRLAMKSRPTRSECMHVSNVLILPSLLFALRGHDVLVLRVDMLTMCGWCLWRLLWGPLCVCVCVCVCMHACLVPSTVCMLQPGCIRCNSLHCVHTHDAPLCTQPVKFDISALQPEEPDSAAHREEGGGGRGARAGATRSGVPQPARATTPQQQRLQQRGAATSRGSKLPTAEAGGLEEKKRDEEKKRKGGE